MENYLYIVALLRWPPRVGIQWTDYSASPFSLVRVKLALNRLVPVPWSCCAPTIRGRGAGWAGAVQLGGLVHEAHNISWDHI